MSKPKSFSDDKLNVTENVNFVFQKQENIVIKGEKAGSQLFHLFSQCFYLNEFSSEASKVAIVWQIVKDRGKGGAFILSK